MTRLISLGAGVQSSAMLLMALEGRFGDVPSAAIFADTQAEPESVYRWLDWLEAKVAPFPIYRVTKGSLEDASLEVKGYASGNGKRWMKSQIPAFLRMPVRGDPIVDEETDEVIGYEPSNGDWTVGILGRSCTADYKLRALFKQAKALAGVKRGQKTPVVEQWIGISTDEAHRMKPSREAWAVTRYPLIGAGLSRSDCLDWMQERGYPRPPRSACVFCPYHSDAEWLRLRDEEPEAFGRAVRFDKALRETQARVDNLIGVPFLHRSLKPLDQVTFKHDGQGRMFIDGFGNECEGMCGL